jgi:Lrp/AsnC family transcriptional regulator for asnA, asnC and gidA
MGYSYISHFFLPLQFSYLIQTNTFMEKGLKIDGIDKIIIKRLVENARTPILTIAREVGISGAAIHQRLRKLEHSDLIVGSKMVLNPKALGYTTTAFIGIFLDSASMYNSAIKRLKEIPEVVESHYTTGNYAVFIKMLCKNNEDLMHLLNNDIQTIKGVARTETFISLDQQIDRQIKI